MLGKPYFDLARAIYRAPAFDDLVDLLVARLPLLIGADEALVLNASPIKGLYSISDHGPIARLLGGQIDLLNRRGNTHPITEKVDFDDPGDLGFAMSDFISPEENRSNEFSRQVLGDRVVSDVLFGLMVNGRRRKAFLNCFLEEGTFGSQARERFDAILLTTRGVLDRMEAHCLELSVRQRVFASSGSSPVAIFIVNTASELCPLNHAAVRLSESWWEADEAVRALSPETVAELDVELDEAWVNPVTGSWREINIDLGGGEMAVHAFPKLSGEVILMFSVGNGNGREEAMAILTRRQREIMEWIAEGKTSAEAAIILGISPRTVEKHLEAVFQRLGVENRIAAMRRYLDLKRGE